MSKQVIHPDSVSEVSKKPKNQAIKSICLGITSFGVFSFCTLFLSPAPAQAGFFSALSDFFDQSQVQAEAPTAHSEDLNSQNMPVLQASLSSNPDVGKGGGDITIVSGDSLLAETGPSGSIADIIDAPQTDQISTYVVHPGDNLSLIAEMFGVSVNTIVWANDIRGGIITPGQTLVILPISGVKYEVKTGDTLDSIAKKFKADKGEILQFNDFSLGKVLVAGETVIVPDGEIDAPVQSGTVKRSSSGSGTSRIVKGYSGPDYGSYYIHPVAGYIHKTQGLHGYNGVDIHASVGTPVRAMADGIVIISKNYGYNGGYGSYVAIQHMNGTETLYGHLSQTLVGVGIQVKQGETIGLSGNTGKSTGPHLHIEVRGARNPEQDLPNV